VFVTEKASSNKLQINNFMTGHAKSAHSNKETEFFEWVKKAGRSKES
jgi:hypothetical protein